MLRRLALSAVADAYYYKNNNCNNIGSHFEKLLNAYTEVRNIVVNNKKSAKEDGTENADIRFPYGEDNERDGKPASVAKAVVGPNSASVVHNIIKAAESGNHAANAGCKVFVFADIDTGGIRSGGIFAHGAEVKTDPCAFEHKRSGNGNDYCGIRHKAV